MANPLQALLELPDSEKSARGLQHTPREIWQQPDTWIKTFQLCSDRQQEIRDVLMRAGIGSAVPPAVRLVGAGTSDFTACALAGFLSRCWKTEASAVASTTLLTEFDQFHTPEHNYLWISFSRSGQSPEGVALLERTLVRNPNIRHLVVTCNRDGVMACLCSQNAGRAFALVLDDAVNDRGLAMTSSFSNMLVAGLCLGNVESLPEFGQTMARMAAAGNSFLVAAAEVASAIADEGCEKACFVGSGPLRAVAQESALKVVELTGGAISTMSESCLGLRHGPLSSVDREALFVAFLSTNPVRRGYEKDLLAELRDKKLGRIRVVVTALPDPDLSGLADRVLTLDVPADFPDDYRPPLDVIFGQSLGLFLSLAVGLKPDSPSPSGSISRTVPPIRVYA